MSRRPDDDLSGLLDELSGTLDRLQTELDDERGRPARRGDRDRRREGRAPPRRRERDRPSIPRPGRFLQFTEEYTIPTLIAFLEANIRALELLGGLLRLLRGGEVSERRVESVGRRTLGQVDDLLSGVQGALEGRPSNPDARDLLEEARSLRTEIDDRIAGGALRREADSEVGRSERRPPEDDGDRRARSSPASRARDAPVTIDVSDDDRRETDRDHGGRRGEKRREDERTRRDEVDVDSELDSLREQVRGDGEDEGGEPGRDVPADEQTGDDGADDENGDETGK